MIGMIGMKTCPECNGTGFVTFERPVIDYQNGGYLEEVQDECWNCGGTGEIEDWGDEDEDNA